MRNIVSPLSGIQSPFGQLTSPLAIYAVLGKSPELALDFSAGKYFTSGSTTTFSEAITHAASSNATMVDSDGLLKWRPHNLLTYSEQFDNAAWIKTGSTLVAANQTVAPDGTLTADLVQQGEGTPGVLQQTGIVSNGQTKALWARSVSGSGTIALGGYFGVSKYVVELTEEWQFFEFDSDTSETGGATFYAIDFRAGTLNECYIWGAHLYRSDLGGMVDNPDRGDSYVPTTSSAVYLPRRGHHVYNGDSWVNKGLLHESEARTNLITNSQLGGAVVGIVGSGGSLPTGWSSALFDTVEVVSIDTYRGAPRIRIKATKDNSAGGSSIYPHIAISSYSPAPSTAYTYSLTGMDGPDDTILVRSLLVPDGVSNFINTPFRDVSEMTLFAESNTTSASATGTQTVRIAHTVAAGDVRVSDFYVSMPQFEIGSTPSSYIPTSGATVTRAAETLTVPAANLPWPTPNVIGEELVTNGGFDTDSDWTKGTGWTISGGVALCDSTSTSYKVIKQSQSIIPNKVYQITFSLTSVENRYSDRIGLTLGGNASAGLGTYLMSSLGVTSDGTHTVLVTAGSETTNLEFFARFTESITIDNISVKEINPLAVSIQMQGEMTYADEAGLDGVFVRWYADASNNIRIENWTSSARTGQVIFTQYAGGIIDQSISSFTAYTPDINVPFNIASRHGSTFINGSVDGTALTADTTPVALPDLSSTDLSLGFDYMGTISLFRIWADDLGDAGIAEAST